jgi:tetraacyldisaccharide 4'-kinase
MFDLGLLNSTKYETPIICIGNLETGGTGKSPLVHYVVHTLLHEGVKVAVLSRGYGRSTSGFREVESCNLATEVGDEPLQTKLRFPTVKVIVCENRVLGVRKLLDFDSKPDVIVMDDGFQHRWIKPSMNILVTPNKKPFWSNYLLPVGSLREAKSEAYRADAVVISNSEEKGDVSFNGKAFHSKVTLANCVQLYGERLDFRTIDKVVLISGIANSERFEDSASKYGEILTHMSFNDHHQYAKKDLQRLKEKYDSFGGAAKAIFTTEKDAARISNSPFINELGQTPVFYLPINIEFLGNDKLEFDKMILAYGKHA